MPRRNRLKLFVWTEFCPDYTDGLAFAVAHNETEAREMIVKQRGFGIHDWGILSVHRLDRRIAKCVSGGG